MLFHKEEYLLVWHDKITQQVVLGCLSLMPMFYCIYGGHGVLMCLHVVMVGYMCLFDVHT